MIRRCRELVRQHTGAVWDPDRVRAVAETAMRQALQGKDNPADVINVALEELTGQGYNCRPIRCWIVSPDRCGPRSTASSTGCDENQVLEALSTDTPRSFLCRRSLSTATPKPE